MVLNKKFPVKVLWVFLIAATVFPSCKKYVFDEITLTPEAGLPLFYGQISLTDILKYETDSMVYLYEGEDQLMHLAFEQNLDTITANDFFEGFYETDTVIRDFIPLDFVDDFYEIRTDLDAKVSFDESIDIYRIDSIRLDSCLLLVELEADSSRFDTLSLEVPSFFNADGDPVTVEFSAEEHHSAQVVSLHNGAIYLEPARDTPGLVNLKMHLKFSKKNGNQGTRGQKLRFMLYDLKIKSFHGRFGNKTEPIDKSSPFLDSIPLLENESVFLDIAEPEVYLFFRNGFNFPFAFQNMNLEAGNALFRQKIEGVPPVIEVDAGTNGDWGYGEGVFLPKTNLETVLGSFPEQIFFKGDILLNPGDMETPNSIYKNDSMFIGIKGDIPLNLQISEVVYRQEMESVNLKEVLDEAFEAVKFNAIIKNNFPAELTAQVFFMDAGDRIIARAFKEPLVIKSGNPETNQHFEKAMSAEFKGETLDAIRESQPMLELRFLTTDGNGNRMVRFLATHNLDFNFFAFAKTKIQP